MLKHFKIIIFVTVILFLFPGLLLADLIVLKNGDKLYGKIQNRYFSLDSPYGKIVIKYDFIKKLTLDENKPAAVSFQSINNDIFSGILLIDEVQIRLDNGQQKSINTNKIESIRIDSRDSSYKITTAIFTMKNTDKFSGKLLTADLTIKSGYLEKLIRSETITRIEMNSGEQGDVRILLNSGDIITGKLLEQQFQVAPDVIGQLTIDKSKLSSIQFNAQKMVLNEYIKLSQSELDSDGDGIANHLDKYPQTPKGIPVDARGCMAMKDILFDFDKFNLRGEYYSVLYNVVSTLMKNSSLNVEIKGHADNIGTAEYNQNLSESRALEVKWYLINKGVDKERISTIGYGYTKNKASNDTAAGRALNRRAEILIME
jgi:outer membrane protein OmpA-like peptidoglycan-associated protein